VLSTLRIEIGNAISASATALGSPALMAPLPLHCALVGEKHHFFLYRSIGLGRS
jgi:hypothetical protein